MVENIHEKNTLKPTALDFNKEILFGEIGSFIGAFIAGFVSSDLTSSANLISSSAVVGSVIGSTIFWLFMRAYDERKRHELSAKKLATDIAFFSPAAAVITIILYYPTIFYFSEYLLSLNFRPTVSVIISQLTAFALFLIMINIYRAGLLKLFKKEI